MRKPSVIVAIVVIVVALGQTGCGQSQVEQPARLIAMEDFFRNPEQTAFDLSPDGEHVAFLAPWESRLNVHVRAIGSPDVVRVSSPPSATSPASPGPATTALSSSRTPPATRTSTSTRRTSTARASPS